MWTLQVYHNGSTQTYAATVIERADGTSIEERASADAVEMADVEVSVDGNFLGVGSIFNLPTTDGNGYRDWRARLLWDGNTVIDGVIERRGGIEHDPDHERWRLRIVQRAPEDFLTALEAIRFVDPDTKAIHADLSGVAVDTIRFEDATGFVSYMDAILLTDLWDEVKSLLTGYTVSNPTLFEYETRYIDSLAVEQSITRQAPLYITAMRLLNFAGDGQPPAVPAGFADASLPEWTGRTLYEALAVMEAWRARTVYSAFPARTITVDLFSDQAPDPGGVAIDALIELDGRPILSIDSPEYEDIGVTYLEPFRQILYNGLTPAESDHFYLPENRVALYASSNEKFGSDGRPDNETVIELPFRLLHVTDHRQSTGENPFSGTDPDYQETHLIVGHIRVPEDQIGDAFVFEAELTDGEATYPQMITQRENTAAGGRPADEPQYFCGFWAVQVIDKYDMSRRETFTAGVIVDGLARTSFVVGDPTAGVEYLGQDWLVESLAYEPATDRMRLVLRASAATAEDVSGGGAPILPFPVLLPPRNLAVSCVCSAGEFDVTATWLAPTSGTAPSTYNVEAMAFYEATFQTIETTASLSSTWTAAGRADRGPLYVRVRSVAADGSVSAWAYTNTECPTCGESPAAKICWNVPGTMDAFEFVGTGSVADGDPITGVLGNHAGTLGWSETGGTLAYVDRGLKIVDGTGSPAFDLQVDPDMFADPFTILLFFDRVDNTYNVNVQLIQLSWASGDGFVLTFQESSGPNRIVLQAFEVAVPIQYAANVSYNNALDNTSANFLAVTYDRANKTWTLDWYDDAASTWETRTGSWTTANPDTTVPDGTDPAVIFYPQPTTAEVTAVWMQVVNRVLSTAEIQYIYNCIRNNEMPQRDFTLYTELPPWPT